MLLLGVAKCEGEISAQQKAALLDIFQREFHLQPDEAADLLLASAHLIRNEIYLVDNIDKILQPSNERFTDAQIASLTALMQRVARLEGAPNHEQERLIEAIVRYFQARRKPKGTWGNGTKLSLPWFQIKSRIKRLFILSVFNRHYPAGWR